jgi:integrase
VAARLNVSQSTVSRLIERDELPSLQLGGLEHRPPYALRHTYATFSIAAGVSLFALARRMGTSVQQIDKTYGHLLPDPVEYERGLLDAFDAAEDAFWRGFVHGVRAFVVEDLNRVASHN